MKLSIAFLLLSLATTYGRPKDPTETCGYSSCPKYQKDGLNIHIVAHTHDDVGWVKTVNRYYNEDVQYILDTVIENLVSNPERRFIYVEMAFFWMWWQKQDEKVRDQVKNLVQTGRLEFIGGAWSMNDEATTNYQSTIDQTTWGFRKLDELFGECAHPKIGWQIDPFGHSREEASLFSQFGFDGLLFSRIDYRDKAERMETKTAEMIWKASESLGSSAEIFTSILWDLYQAPPGFCFDTYCGDEQIDDDPNSPYYNSERRAKEFVAFVENKAKGYKSNNILITMGGDFNFENATKNFVNIDKLIKAINKLDTNSHAYYSTPSCYVHAVNEADLTWPTKTDDFFSYASKENYYWTGYYTSRPTLKRFERIGNNYLQLSKQLSSLSVPEDSVPKLDPLREAMGVMQHHDAVSGTEKQKVANDYAKMLHEGLVVAEEATQDAFKKLLPKDSNLQFQSCLLLNISQCALTENNDKFVVAIYNPLSRTINKYVRLPVAKDAYKVTDSDGNNLEIQYVPIFERILNIPGRDSKATMELVFRAESIPPLGFKLFYVHYEEGYKMESSATVTNENVKLNLDEKGLLKSFNINDNVVQVNQEYLYYTAGESGAYVFEPNGEKDIPEVNPGKEYQGPLVYEYHSILNDWVGQVIRIYPQINFYEFNWVVGPIPIEDDIGKEVVIRFKTNMNTNGIFYTDANGREMLKRELNHRSNFKIDNDNDEITRNYFPVTSMITMRDEQQNIELAVLNDRSQGGGSVQNGYMEFMLHRRILQDDYLGVEEPLNETAFNKGLVAVGKHYLTLGIIDGADGLHLRKRLQAKEILNAPWTFISPVDDKFDENDIKNVMFAGLKQALPDNVHILTLEPWQPNVLLLRLEHIFEKNEDSKLSQPVTVNLKDLFSTFDLVEMKELSLGANQLASKVEKLKWKSEDNNEAKLDELKKSVDNLAEFEVTLNPMEIKTYAITIKTSA